MEGREEDGMDFKSEDNVSEGDQDDTYFDSEENMEGEDREDITFSLKGKKKTPRSAKCVLSGSYKDEVYSMKYEEKATCLIFNHEVFTCGPKPRPYSYKDVAALRRFFESRKFHVEVETNKSVDEIKSILKKAQKKNYEKASCFVCCVLTHGTLDERTNQEFLYAKDGVYPTETLLSSFSGNECDTLAGKPKIFFIQACRGGEYDTGINTFYKSLQQSLGFASSSSSSLVGTEGLLGEFDFSFLRNFHNLLPWRRSSASGETLVCCKIPVKADFLIAYSTPPKSVSWKRTSGSWFIQVLCNTLEERADDSDLLSMLTIVCRKVAYDYQSVNTESKKTDNMKQVPSLYSTLTKTMKFPERDNSADAEACSST